MKKFVVVIHCESDSIDVEKLRSREWWSGNAEDIEITNVQANVLPKTGQEGRPRRGSRGNAASSANLRP